MLKGFNDVLDFLFQYKNLTVILGDFFRCKKRNVSCLYYMSKIT